MLPCFVAEECVSARGGTSSVMAPRKRTTKQRKNNPKTAKLEAFLEDFDSEVKTRVGQLKEKFNQLLKDVDNSYNMALIKLPKAVRQTTWLEHCKPDKPKSPEVDNVKREEEAAIVESVVAEDHCSSSKISQENHFSLQPTASKKKAKSSSEDENTPGTTRKGKATRKPPTTSKRAKALSVSKQNTSIRRSTRKPLVTPARSMLDSSLMMGATPLITPRFDPRLPKTPAVRVPRHKERVYSISVNGSPIAAGNEDIVINVPIGNGESVQLLGSQMDSVDLSLLDETALKSIRLLQNRLTTLCGTSE
ncbi:Borealin Cell division cycle-associated protein 8 Dasra-B [Larimichthys crocea]|uniref:Borealin Cell division cycle-associated protein 8 Dasra-B n=1 Tax=Larimichthys crocea TaxID=215358 RepID=A0A6G0HRD0_LARCR|nr:Borealin Cell division cycle-associated protein 8 Dasra-B [Larimichthys crocea]